MILVCMSNSQVTIMFNQFSSVAQSCLTLWTPWTAAGRPPCPSPTPGAYSNSCLSLWWCHPPISSSVIPFPSHLQYFPSIRVCSNESVLHIRWPKYCSFSFSISPSNEYLGLGLTTWISLHPLPTTKEKTLHMDITRWSIPKSDWLHSLQQKMEKLYTVSKNKTGG